MDISNSTQSIQTNLRPTSTQTGSRSAESKSAPNTSVIEPIAIPVARSESVDPSSIAEKERSAQALRVQRLNDTESLSLQSRKALDEYQGTLAASNAYGEGELVGIDLFV